MRTFRYAVRKLIYGIPMLLGVTLISFVLMVYFGPDKTYDLLGKNPTQEAIDNVRHKLGYDRNFVVRYGEYVKEVITLDFGNSDSSGERVIEIFKRAIPVTLMVEIPGFVLGNLLAIAIALFAAFYRGRWIDRIVMTASVIGMSISILIIIIAFQIAFCSSYGLNFFPVTGFYADSLSNYLLYVTVPTLIIIFVSLGYNTRFYRAILVEEMSKDHVRTARAFGCPATKLLTRHVLRNCLIPIITRVNLSIPYLIIGGSLLIESYFGIPGIGLVTFDAITTGDLPIVKAAVALTAIMYVVLLIVTDIMYQMVDPRVVLR